MKAASANSASFDGWVMEFLFDSRGRHIANRVGAQLHAPRGQNIGHWLEREGIFINMRGGYLGEIIHIDRLMYCTTSPYRSVNFGIYGNYGNAGNYGIPGHGGSIGSVPGFVDVKTPWI
jgi:hypothetical protein